MTERSKIRWHGGNCYDFAQEVFVISKERSSATEKSSKPAARFLADAGQGTPPSVEMTTNLNDASGPSKGYRFIPESRNTSDDLSILVQKQIALLSLSWIVKTYVIDALHPHRAGTLVPCAVSRL